MAAPGARSLYDLLIDATVKLTAGDGQGEGTGFFVAKGKVLTCAHVVRNAAGAVMPMKARYRGMEYPVDSIEPAKEDVCLLTLPPFEHTCVRMVAEVEPRDPLFWHGFPGTGTRNRLRGESSTAASEGVVEEVVDCVNASFIKFAPGAVKPGMSGAPLLNERTGGVCGLVKRTRNSEIDQGGLAVSVAHAWEAFAGIRAEHERWHRDDPAWELAYRRSGAALQQAIVAGPPFVVDKILSRLFRPLIEARTEDFVGRDFIFAAIDEALSDASGTRGYVMVTAEPGLGKTALMAQLVKTRGYAHHFNVTSLDVRSPSQFVDNICGQLIVKYGLNPVPRPESAAEYGGYLSTVIAAAAQVRGGEPVVLLVDAIDEATDDLLPRGANRLFLPRDLPAGVFVILTSRPMAEYRLVVDRLRTIPLSEDGEGNQRDVVEYISRFIDRHEGRMTSAIAAWGVGEPDFVKALRERSEGNFMYLKHVLQDIRDGQLTRDTIADVYSLPVGIREYYRWHWSQTSERDPVAFDDVTKPVVCAFAAAKEPVSVAQVVHWTRARWPALTVDRILGVIAAWRPFLDEVRPPGSPPLYRIYHSTFREFLEEVEGLSLYHDLIIDSALAQVPGLGFDARREASDGNRSAR